MKNGTPLWHEAHFQVKMHKTPRGRSNFGSSDEKSHAAVAPSTFVSQNAPKTLSEGPILEVSIRKNCTPLWREVHL